MRRKFFLFVVLVVYSFVLRWKNPMKGLLSPVMDVTEFHQPQSYSGKAQLVSHLPQQKEECDLVQNVFQKKSPSPTFSSAPILSQFMVAYTPNFTISAHNNCE